jgi:hypothetical protein
MEDLVESECERHGLDRHVVVHEAGHAVAAIDAGIPFRAIVMYGPNGGPTFDNGLRHAAAAVEMLSNDPSTWVVLDYNAALRFVLAGSLAEIAVLDHAIDGGFSGDVKAWRRGMGSTGELTTSELDEVVGRPFLDVVDETQHWAEENSDRIALLADRLAGLPPDAELPYDDVVSFLA